IHDTGIYCAKTRPSLGLPIRRRFVLGEVETMSRRLLSGRGLASFGLMVVASLVVPATALSLDYGWSTSSNGSLGVVHSSNQSTNCTSSDGGADGSVDAFKFRNNVAGPGQATIQMNYPRRDK